MDREHRRNRRRPRKGTKESWVVSIDRPEEIFGNPAWYYTDDEIEKYARCGGMRKTQEKIALRILELLDLDRGKLLDLGCGVGYTTSVYESSGFDVIGLDVLPKMLDKARGKELKVIEGDMRNLKELFKQGEFDGVVSASALQWLKAREDIARVASGAYYTLKDKGKLVIQFYPKSQEELMKTARTFKREGFQGQVIVDNPKNPKKRVIYLVMNRV